MSEWAKRLKALPFFSRYVSRLAQEIHGRLLRPTTGNPEDRISRAVAGLTRRGLIKWCDPPVTYSFEGTTLLMPLSHELPYYRRRFPDYSRNIGRIAGHLYEKRGGEFTIVDIGANIGDTLAILRARVPSPVLCIEPHPLFAHFLRENAKSLGPVVVEQALVGRGTEMVSMAAGASGTASIRTASLSPGDTDVTVRTETLSTIIARHPAFRRAGLVKVDTDGYDAQVLLGAAHWFEEEQPVLFFEHDPHLEERAAGVKTDAIDLLRGLGYRYISIFSNEGEYVVSSESIDEPFLQEILRYFSGRRDRRYCDIAAYTSRDADVWAQTRKGELKRL